MFDFVRHAPPQKTKDRRIKVPLTICDCVLPWCFLLNSASPFPKPEGFKCAGNALFNAEAMVYMFCRVYGRGGMEKKLDLGVENGVGRGSFLEGESLN